MISLSDERNLITGNNIIIYYWIYTQYKGGVMHTHTTYLLLGVGCGRSALIFGSSESLRSDPKKEKIGSFVPLSVVYERTNSSGVTDRVVC